MDSICRFIPAKEYSGSLRTVRFVLESKFHTLSQPFYYPIHYLFLVVSGSGTLCLNGKEFAVKTGSLFFSFPQYFHRIKASEDFVYVYISFMGDAVAQLLEELGVSGERPVFDGYERLIDFWVDAVRLVEPANANLLTEGVLQYTLAMLMSGNNRCRSVGKGEERFAQILEQINVCYTDPEFSLGILAEAVSYSPKYLSRVFKNKMGIGFTKYLNNLRVQQACRLMEEGNASITKVAAQCGFADPMYFSKVFKHYTGFSPQVFLKRIGKDKTI